MGAVATFNYSTWVARYPELSQVQPAQAQAYFEEAGLYHNNNGGGRVSNVTTQLLLMNMVTAHIAFLNAPDSMGNAPNAKVVGKLQSGGQGSVNVTVAYEATNPEQWYAQSQYGASYWAATAIYRTFRPVRGRRRQFGLFPWTLY